MVRPAGLEPATPGLEVFGSEATEAAAARCCLASLRHHRRRPREAARGSLGLSVNCQSTSAAENSADYRGGFGRGRPISAACAGYREPRRRTLPRVDGTVGFVRIVGQHGPLIGDDPHPRDIPERARTRARWPPRCQRSTARARARPWRRPWSLRSPTAPAAKSVQR